MKVMFWHACEEANFLIRIPPLQFVVSKILLSGCPWVVSPPVALRGLFFCWEGEVLSNNLSTETDKAKKVN